MKNNIVNWLVDNQQVLIGSFVGGWIQLWFAKKKGAKFSIGFVLMNFVMAMFVGYWAAEAATALNKPEWGVFVASWSAIASNTIMNLYNTNQSKIWRSIASLKFNIKTEDKEKE